MITNTVAHYPCLRCSTLKPEDELSHCTACNTRICPGCATTHRCMCFDVRMTLWPDAATLYYGILDRLNTHPDTMTPGDELQLSMMEGYFSERESSEVALTV